MTILPENMLNNLFENLVTQFVKDNLESIMKAEIQQFMISEEAGNHNSRNGAIVALCPRIRKCRGALCPRKSSVRLPNAAV